MTGEAIPRRRFVVGAGAALVALGGLGWGAAAVWSDRRGSELSKWLEQLFDRPGALEPLGRHALGTDDGGWTTGAIAAELGAIIGWVDDSTGTTVARSSVEEAATTLAAAARSDFDAGDTVEIDGWLLSRTEVRLVRLVGTDASL